MERDRRTDPVVGDVIRLRTEPLLHQSPSREHGESAVVESTLPELRAMTASFMEVVSLGQGDAS